MFNLCCCHGQQDLFPVATAPFYVIGRKRAKLQVTIITMYFSQSKDKSYVILDVLFDPLLPVKYNINRLLDVMLSKEQKTLDISLSICNFFKWHP